MLADLKLAEDSLFNQASLQQFYAKHDIYEVIAFLNKSKKQQSKQRIKYLLSKTSQSLPLYKMLLHAPLTETEANKKQFLNYLSSQNSEQYFQMLNSRQSQLLPIIRQNPHILPILLQLVAFEHGIKMPRLFKAIYDRHHKQYEKQLLSEQVKVELIKGIGLVDKDSKQFLTDLDTVAQMRFAQIIVNISILGGNCYEFVEDLLSKLLHLYKTEDILLKINLVQVISTLGQAQQTSKMLKQHPIWKYIEKDASDKQQDFYIRKYLMLLLVEMWNQGKYQMSFKVQKDFQDFIKTNILNKGQYQQAALDIITSLYKEYQGIKVIVKNSQIFNKYILVSRNTENSLKQPYLESLICLTSLNSGTNQAQKKRATINILNCIGNPSLCTGLSHNIDSNTIMIQGLQAFSQWFSNYLMLPFCELEVKLLNIFINLLQYREVVQYLFQNQNTTKYLLRPINDTNSDKVMRYKKNNVLSRIIQKGNTEWKGHELQQYCRMLQKELKHTKMEVQYALDVE